MPTVAASLTILLASLAEDTTQTGAGGHFAGAAGRRGAAAANDTNLILSGISRRPAS